MVGRWDITANLIGGGMLYAVYRLRDVNAVDHSGNRELATGYMESRAEAEKIAEKMNRIEKINNILEMYGGSATRQDMRERTNVYLMKELLQCNMEDSTLLAIAERFLSDKETLSYIHDVLIRHYENI